MTLAEDSLEDNTGSAYRVTDKEQNKENNGWPKPSTDAMAWAEDFKKRISSNIDIDTMVGWFANAIMAGMDEGMRRSEEEIRELRRDLEESREQVSELSEEIRAANIANMRF